MILPDPMVVGDEDSMLASFRRIKKLQDDGALIVFGHDPVQWKQLNSGPFREITRDAISGTIHGATPVA